MPRFRCRLIKNIFAAIMALVLLACAVEVGLRYYDNETGWVSEETASQLPYLAASSERYCRLQSMKTFQVKHPDSGKITELKTNSFGLRGNEIQVPKPTGLLRIICLGDERVLAAETPEKETFSYQLQQLLQSRTRLRVEVINAGVPHSCPLLSCLHLRQSLLGLQPDLVILNFDMSDIADDHRLRRHLITDANDIPLACAHPTLQKKDQQCELHHRSPFLLLDWGKNQIKSMKNSSGETRDLQDIDSPQGEYAWIRDDPPDWSIYIKQALRPIGQIQTMTEGSYARMLVGVIPTPWQVSDKACQNKTISTQNGIEQGKSYRSRVPFETVANYTDQKKILFCDSSPYFLQRKNPEQLFLKNEIRLSPTGHELYARVLASFVIAKIPGPWLSESEMKRPKKMASQPRRQQ